MIQPLERRCLLHSFNVTPEGFLVVQMFDVNERVEFTQGQTAVNVTMYQGGQVEASESFLLSLVNSVIVYGSAVANVINMGNVSIPVGIDAGKGSDSIIGGNGPDALKGGAGNDTIIGNDGDDYIDGGKGRDSMTGGSGRDMVDYRTRTGDLSVILSDVANNGEAGENDIVTTSFEIIRAGAGNDTLGTTSARAVTLIGNAGNDTLNGGKGNDALDGGDGLDVFNGNAGDDTFYAQDGIVETLRGGSGTDTILQKDKKDKLVDIP